MLQNGFDSTLSWNRSKTATQRRLGLGTSETQLKVPKRLQQLRIRCVPESLTAPCFTAAGDSGLYSSFPSAPGSG